MSNYHVGWRSREAYSDEAYERDLNDHLLNRCEEDRSLVVPWLDTLRPLRSMKILEIGCGTGSSTVALAEQGATVVGIDVDEGAVLVARDRCRVYGITADICVMGAEQIRSEFQGQAFDLIIFFACLEHMTVRERLGALSQAWEILPEHGMLGLTETPNRLWFFDHHTSHLPFFQWLPDELAFQYSRFSARENFREIYRELTAESFQHFLRRGRGVSFHEFDLAIQPVSSLNLAPSLSAFLEKNGLYTADSAHMAFSKFLQRQSPAVPAPFFERDLNLVIQKSRSEA
jgi:2-polyprenyl-3-methyl-5-hydroxy-6-metoxy-1,4-benzoquinol methylase